MTSLIRTDAARPEFAELVKNLDIDLARRDGADHSFYAQYNTLHSIKHVVLLFENEKAVACGAIKELEPNCMEVKRMYTLPAFRGRGFAGQVLEALEKWAKELGYQKCRLETGKRQPEAIALYTKQGYQIVPNYGQYAGIDNSVCFEKLL